MIVYLQCLRLRKKSSLKITKQTCTLQSCIKKYDLNKHAVYKLVAQLGLPRRHKPGITRNSKKSKEDQQMKLELAPESKITTSFKIEDGTAHVYMVINSSQPIDSIQVHIEVPKEEK
ncbi:hypothetical protein QCM8_187 [Bacillus phage QCM8]|nr:hypothetical protein QCM8_187 [Bacillus phage QCM8]